MLLNNIRQICSEIFSQLVLCWSAKIILQLPIIIIPLSEIKKLFVTTYKKLICYLILNSFHVNLLNFSYGFKNYMF